MQQFSTVTTFTSRRRKPPEVYRLGRRAYKKVANENGLNNIISTIHSGYYLQHFPQKFETA
jgi:hypothetical protein